MPDFNPVVPLLVCLAAPLLVVALLRLIGDGTAGTPGGGTGAEPWRGKEC